MTENILPGSGLSQGLIVNRPEEYIIQVLLAIASDVWNTVNLRQAQEIRIVTITNNEQNFPARSLVTAYV